MEIIDINVVGYYFYSPDLKIENYNGKTNKKKLSECVICKRSIFEPSYESITDNTQIIKESEITIGKCGHVFHSICINNWTKSNKICPIDKVEWRTFRVADSTTKLVLNNDGTNILTNEQAYEKHVKPIKDMGKKNNIYHDNNIPPIPNVNPNINPNVNPNDFDEDTDDDFNSDDDLD